MSSIQEKILQFLYSKKVILFLLSLLVATFPFGAYLFSVSIGFMSIYPYLLLLLILAVLGLYRKSFLSVKSEKFYVFFLLFLVLYAVSYLPFVESVYDAKVDIRNVFLMLVTAFVFIWTKDYLGFQVWKRQLLGLLKIIYVMIVSFSILELKTGIHIRGYFTDKIADLHMIGNIYTPVFLYDNPNNLTVYVFLIGLMILILDGFTSKNYLLTIVIISTDFFIARLCKSRFGELAAGVWLLWVFINLIRDKLKERRTLKRITKFYLLWTIVVFSLGIMTFALSPKYYSPIWTSSSDAIIERTKMEEDLPDSLIAMSKAIDLNSTLLLEEKDVVDSVRPLVDRNYASGKIRMSLYFNGLEYVKDSYGLGIGPGQFRYKHSVGDKKYYTKTNIGPHFWLIELLSQFGIIPFLLYVLGVLYFVFFVLKKVKTSFYLKSLLLFSFPIFFILSVLPSGFLIFDVNWVFSVVLIICVNSAASKNGKLEA